MQLSHERTAVANQRKMPEQVPNNKH